ncbi:MAG: hypothetical protein COB02_15295 [Candidatus Cloacimonadota bacterium]|nr:MAG: hypothetical protein COB02_15295 [Candidatus Cloacimonadota bacterium]
MYFSNKTIFYHDIEYKSDSYDYQYFLNLNLHLPDKSDSWASKRKRDYLVGRFCAREAFKQVSVFDTSHFQLIKNEDGTSNWPTGFCGSITHTKDYACAVIAQSNKILSIGIDCEYKIKDKTFQRVKKSIASDSEINIVNKFTQDEQLALTLIFSAKESVYKAVFPLVKTFFYFEAFQIDTINQNYIEGFLTKDLNQNFSMGKKVKIQYKITNQRVNTLVLITS